ncbi:hypothetical protein AAU61_20400 [Desulfocarbo indianensis]|nr:hypothetical protein AAU61_20400 [Desulfocarbo indianensis]
MLPHGQAAEPEAWAAHPQFAGVSLQHLITGSHSQGRFSLHLVRVEPGRALGEHRHPEQWELHEVLKGRGSCRLADHVADYRPKTLALIPPGSLHQVNAGPQGLLIKALFVPALL